MSNSLIFLFKKQLIYNLFISYLYLEKNFNLTVFLDTYLFSSSSEDGTKVSIVWELFKINSSKALK